ncbi:MAG: hypothetical protein IPO15_27285 [Anaerolineae bacterium]|nr:hypothetical protein [Anaerolineae bacterium]
MPRARPGSTVVFILSGNLAVLGAAHRRPADPVTPDSSSATPPPAA